MHTNFSTLPFYKEFRSVGLFHGRQLRIDCAVHGVFAVLKVRTGSSPLAAQRNRIEMQRSRAAALNLDPAFAR
jgi:hypothetical protein